MTRRVYYSFCWFPLNLINILNDYYPASIAGSEYFVLLFFLAHLLAGSSTCYNPILYAGMNENFRKEFKSVLPCFDAVSRENSLRRADTTFAGKEKTYLNNGQSAVTIDADSTYINTPRLLRKKDENGVLLQVPSYALIIPPEKNQRVDAL